MVVGQNKNDVAWLARARRGLRLRRTCSKRGAEGTKQRGTSIDGCAWIHFSAFSSRDSAFSKGSCRQKPPRILRCQDLLDLKQKVVRAERLGEDIEAGFVNPFGDDVLVGKA